MSEIDFIGNKKSDDGQKSKDQADKKEKIIWSEPDKDKPLVKESPFFWLSFLKPKKKPVTDKSGPSLGKTLDKNEIIKSRREILELIKREKESNPEEKKPADKSWLAGLMEKFKKQPNHKEVLIDYQQVFNQEKVKRNSPAHPAPIIEIPAKPAPSAKAAPLVKAAVKPEPTKSAESSAGRAKQVAAYIQTSAEKAKELKDSFIGRFLKMIKTGMAALGRLIKSAKPARSARPVEMPIKPEFSVQTLPAPVKAAVSPKPARQAETAPLAEPVRPVREEKKETEIKAEFLDREKPMQSEAEPLEFLETNLIKGEIITFFDWRKKIIILANAVLLPIFLIAVVYLGLSSYQKQKQAKILEQDKKFNELRAEIKEEEKGLAEITAFQTKLKVVSEISASHIYWTNFFKFLEDNTLKDIYYTGFSGDTSGNYSLDVVAEKYSNISDQVDILRNNKLITDVQVGGGELAPSGPGGKDKVKFKLNFSILQGIFTE